MSFVIFWILSLLGTPALAIYSGGQNAALFVAACILALIAMMGIKSYDYK